MPPPPMQRDRCRASCLRRACIVPATCVQQREDDNPPPPHTHLRPPNGGGGRKGGADSAPPPPPPRGQSGKEGRQRRQGAGQITRPCPKEARAVQAPAGGAPGVQTQGRKGEDGSHTASPPPPAEGQVPCLVPAPCLRRAQTRGQTARAPPPTPLSPTHPGKGRGQRGGGEGTWGGGQRTDQRARGRDGRRAVETQKKKNKEQSKPTRQGKKARRQGPKPQQTGEGRGDMGPQGTLVKYPTSGVWGPQRGTPPPPCSLALCLRRSCVVPATCMLQREDDKGYKGDDGSGTRTPPPRTTRQGGEAAERGCGTDHTTVPKGSTRRASPNGGTTGGATAG